MAILNLTWFGSTREFYQADGGRADPEEVEKLVHFTPIRLHVSSSWLFYEARRSTIFVTTKSFEIKDYETYGVKTIFVPGL
jgi:hypothetical protein